MPHIGPVFADIRYPTRDPTGISCTGTRPARFWISQIMWLDIRCFPRVLIYYTGTFLWIRIKILSVFSNFVYVDPYPYSKYGSGSFTDIHRLNLELSLLATVPY